MFSRLFRRDTTAIPPQPLVDGRPARIPPDMCVYAVGDVHGRADCLTAVRDLIQQDSAALPAGTTKVVVYVGDFIDRGPDSSAVLDLLIDEPMPGFHAVHLVGNHDAWLLGFLEDSSVGESWLRHGGDATLRSYDIAVADAAEEEDALQTLQAQLRERLPAAQLDFLESLDLYYELGDYLFVHAGIRPGVPLGDQQPEDLLWIREPFLSSGESAGRVVVHGHTITNEPVVRSNRIGIDTGACWTGKLTALVLDGTSFRFLSTSI
ncbi:metallophosphoesterase family protein [Marinivivus vitaminiproducens]|uniref:metallophosphoesterase family protein n=1 Tax=Marinivivus vitaminiproducens TaxID=3035935 RepID=UPI0027A839EE|nr:metallophosphoesterase family protein [Geminicoccaceae bacterium SCSIO 64248]